MSSEVMDSQKAGRTLELVDAPDTDIGVPKPKSHITQVMRMDLDDEMVAKILEAKKKGKHARIGFGRDPWFGYGPTRRALRLVPWKGTRLELYRGKESSGELRFSGLVSHQICASDQFEEQRKAFADLEKPTTKNSNDRVKKPHTKSAATSILRPNTTRSVPTSPGLRPKPSSETGLVLSPLPHGAGPTSVPQSANIPANKASGSANIALLHFLAMRPATKRQIADALSCSLSFLDDLNKYASPVDPSQHQDKAQFRLTDKNYKLLDVYRFPYPTGKDRQDAIDNAIKAFDRMRLTGNDALWQKLLPKKDRGKGIVLSKLNHLHQGIFKGMKSEQNNNIEDSVIKEGPLLPNHREMLAGIGGEPVQRSKPSESKPTASSAADAVTKRLQKKKAGQDAQTVKSTTKEGISTKRKAEDNDEVPKKKARENGNTPQHKTESNVSENKKEPSKSTAEKKTLPKPSNQGSPQATISNGKVQQPEKPNDIRGPKTEENHRAEQKAKPKSHVRRSSAAAETATRGASSSMKSNGNLSKAAALSSPMSHSGVFSNNSTPLPAHHSDLGSRRSSNVQSSNSQQSSDGATPAHETKENIKKSAQTSSPQVNGMKSTTETHKNSSKGVVAKPDSSARPSDLSIPRKLESLKASEKAAWQSYYAIRIEVDSAAVVLDSKRAEAWEKFSTASDLTRRVQKLEAAHCEHADTVAGTFSTESAAYLQGKLDELLPRYEQLYSEVMKLGKKEDGKVKELKGLDREVRELRGLCTAIKEHREKSKAAR